MSTAPVVATSADAGSRLFSIISEFHHHWEGIKSDIIMLWLTAAQADMRGSPYTITELGEAAHMSLASTSRNVQLLETRRETKMSPPLDLLETRAHPTDYRTKIVTLTPKGRNFYTRLMQLMG
ncbi:hypothetical protein ACXHXM_34255